MKTFNLLLIALLIQSSHAFATTVIWPHSKLCTTPDLDILFFPRAAVKYYDFIESLVDPNGVNVGCDRKIARTGDQIEISGSSCLLRDQIPSDFGDMYLDLKMEDSIKALAPTSNQPYFIFFGGAENINFSWSGTVNSKPSLLSSGKIVAACQRNIDGKPISEILLEYKSDKNGQTKFFIFSK